MPLMNPALRPFWNTKSRIKVLTGGRGSSKSHDTCGRLIYLTNHYKLKVLAVRQLQNKIADSVYSLLKTKVEAFGYDDNFEILKNSIESNVGSEFLFYGLRGAITEIKSTEGVDILYIEEAHALTKEQWDVLKPTVRKNNSEIWLVFNPQLVTDFVYKRFILNPPKDCLVRHINYQENPFVSQTFLKEAEEAKEEDEDEYNHIYLGHPRTDDKLSIIKRSWIEAAIDAHLKLDIEVLGTHRVGFDVADDGEDKNAAVSVHGILTTNIEEWAAKENELFQSTERVYNIAEKNGALVNFDSIGVGAGVGSNINEINKKPERTTVIKHNKFNAGGKVLRPDAMFNKDAKISNKEFFSNIKAQTWWEIAERFKKTYNAVNNGAPFEEADIISIDSNCPLLNQLKEELSTPRKDTDNTGRQKVESKKDLAARDVPSPNIADAFIMGYAYSTENNPKPVQPKIVMEGIKLPLSR